MRIHITKKRNPNFKRTLERGILALAAQWYDKKQVFASFKYNKPKTEKIQRKTEDLKLIAYVSFHFIITT